MGFLKKVWSGIKGAVKKIGKGIKSAFMKFGKFMDKIGIIGQIALWYFMPYAAAAIGNAWGAVAGQTAAQAASTAAGAAATSAATTAGATAAQATAAGAAQAASTASTIAAGQAAGATAAQISASTVAIGTSQATGLMSMGSLAKGVGSLMQFTANTVGKAANVYSNITQGVTDTLGNFAATAGKKLGFEGEMFTNAADNFFSAGGQSSIGADTAASRSLGGDSRLQNLTQGQDYFDLVKENRIRDKKLLKAFDETATGSINPDQLASVDEWDTGFGSKYSKDMQISIDRGESNWTASTGTTIPDISATGSIAKNESALENLFDTLNESRVGGPAPVIEGVPAGPKSLLSRFTDGIKDIPKRAYDKAVEIADDPAGFVFEKGEERFQSGVQTRLMQEAGILEKPTYEVTNVTNNAYVPSFESFGGSQQQYGAPEIMNARAFEQQVTNNPNPYGYTAFQYGNYMSQYGTTA